MLHRKQVDTHDLYAPRKGVALAPERDRTGCEPTFESGLASPELRRGEKSSVANCEVRLLADRRRAGGGLNTSVLLATHVSSRSNRCEAGKPDGVGGRNGGSGAAVINARRRGDRRGSVSGRPIARGRRVGTWYATFIARTANGAIRAFDVRSEDPMGFRSLRAARRSVRRLARSAARDTGRRQRGA